MLKGFIKKICLLLTIFIFTKNPFEIIKGYIRKGEFKIKIKDGIIFFSRRGEGKVSAVISTLKMGWEITFKDNLYLFRNKKFKISLLQPDIGAVSSLRDYMNFLFYIKGKNVMDIGGYLGETAVLFKKVGRCKKVVIIEPVSSHLKFIRINLGLNRIKNFKIIQAAVAPEDRRKIILSSSERIFSQSFGLRKGKYRIKVRGLSWDNIIRICKKERIDAIKVDCEGAEKYLLMLSNRKLRYVSYWIIEVHEKNTKRLIQKFKRAGFSLVKNFNRRPHNLLLFKL